ncbi:MAG: helix-turn-helix domain-containing protein [Thermoleophilia bacterium]|nr:helix-turn-helix domain-containing protein [Thermoleophilia bacterium]
MAEDSKEIFCPAIATMRLLGQKWTLEIVRALIEGKKRFNEISQELDGLNARTLSARLRTLEAEGIVERHLISSIPPWVEYELTQKGQSLNAVIEGMAEWGRRWMEPPK